MRNSNQILLGIAILLVGIISLAAPQLAISNFSLMSLAGGFACLLLYRTKRKSWSLVVGTYAIYIGLAGFLARFFSTGIFYTAMFFIAPGVIFLVLYFDKNKKGLLLPGSVLFWFGAYFFLRYTYFYRVFNTFLFCMGCALFTSFFIGKGNIGKWAVYLGAFFFLGSFIPMINVYFTSLPISSPVIIIICGLLVIAGAFYNKKK